MLHPASSSYASRIARGAFLCLFFCFISSCEAEERSTPDWPEREAKQPSPEKKITYVSATESEERVTFMVYNLRNYLNMERGSDRELQPKPENEITDLIANIATVQPDILGICEIGTQADLDDLQKRLKAEDLHLPHTYLHGGADAYRRLAILSKFPLIPHQSANLFYKYDGKSQKILRGILDVSIGLPSGETRFLGAHLKSKRPSEHFDQERVRRHEAELVRKHASNILNTDPKARLLVFGDFNDTKQSPSIRAIVGNHKANDYLRTIDLRASNGSTWTHYWAYQDVYSRFDYVFASPAMRRFIDYDKSFIFEPPKGDSASDHRPLVISIK